MSTQPEPNRFFDKTWRSRPFGHFLAEHGQSRPAHPSYPDKYRMLAGYVSERQVQPLEDKTLEAGLKLNLFITSQLREEA